MARRSPRSPGHAMAPGVRGFDDEVAWLVTHTSKSAVCELMRIAWRSVGAIITRVVAEGRAAKDPFEGLERIGLDEMSYKRGQRYILVAVDHDSGRSSGRHLVVTRRRWVSSSTCWAPRDAATPRCVSTRSTSSVGRPRRSTR